MRKEYTKNIKHSLFRVTRSWGWNLSLLLVTVLMGCEEFVEVDAPRNEIVRENVFNNDATAISTVNGIYSKMIQGGTLSFTNTSMEEFTGIYADEFFTASNDVETLSFASNSVQPANIKLRAAFWGSAYNYLLNANSALEGLAVSEGITDSLKSQLEGEAKFVRAFCHFYLVNLFGPVPLAISSDVETNTAIVPSLHASIIHGKISTY